ncbi:hypothetical protein JCM14469_05130 [Desulfatiferula olefinivorans]
MCVFIDLSSGSFKRIGLFLETLALIDEGFPCHYVFDPGERRLSQSILELLVSLSAKKEVGYCDTSYDAPFPYEIIEGGSTGRACDMKDAIGIGLKYTWFKRNKSLFRAIDGFDRVLFLTPDAVILRPSWLKELVCAAQDDPNPVTGYSEYVQIGRERIPCAWSTVGVYKTDKLKSLPLTQLFETRMPNPWFPLLRQNAETKGHCLSQPCMSAFDMPLNHVLYAVYHTIHDGSDDPRTWHGGQKAGQGGAPFIAGQGRVPADCLENADQPALVVEDKTDDLARYHLRRQYEKTIPSDCDAGDGKAFRLPLGGPSGCVLHDPNEKWEIEDLQGLFKGNRCFIMGNGPSLNRTDLTKLKDEYTIGLNRIYLNYERMGFQPTFLCATNPTLIGQFHRDFDRCGSIKFLRYQTRRMIQNRWNVFFMDHTNDSPFSYNIGSFVWNEGCTVTYCALQVAYYLGFDTVVLVGVDHYFPDAGKPHQLVTAARDDVNHFHPDYFGPGVKWHYPDLAGSEKSYLIAKEVYENDGRRILDATVGGKLGVFEKCDYDAIGRHHNTACRSGRNEE